MMDRPGAVHPELLDWERKLDQLREHFGPSWSWVEIALWTLARGRMTPPLPAWQIFWAREFMATREWSGGERDVA